MREDIEAGMRAMWEEEDKHIYMYREREEYRERGKIENSCLSRFHMCFRNVCSVQTYTILSRFTAHII